VTVRPDDVALVVDFLNTTELESGIDVLDDASAWVQWCRDQGLAPGSNPKNARSTRDALRAALGDERATAAELTVTVAIGLDADGRPGLVTADPIGAVLAAAVRLVDAGAWHRLKLCPADDCRWAFFDRSRNRSRTWCAMEVCGNRAKARSFRRRAGSAPRQPAANAHSD
jgi:predicted RNA-binding Zn ribbon-like protein